jgi:hypothetical protein
VASVVQVPLTDADRSRSSRLASRCYATANYKSENKLGPSRALFHHLKGYGTLRHSVFRDAVSSTVCGPLVPVVSLGKCFNKVSHACTCGPPTGSLFAELANTQMEPTRPTVLCDHVAEARGSFVALAGHG